MKKIFSLIAVAIMAFAAQANLLTVADGDDPVPVEQCETPSCAFSVPAPGRVVVTITNNEPGATVYYCVYRNSELVMEDIFIGENHVFQVEGRGVYIVHAVAMMEDKLVSPDGGLMFTIYDDPQPQVIRGDVNGNGAVNMDDLTALIYYLVNGTEVNVPNTAACNSADDTTVVNMDDLTALIDYLVYGNWTN